MTYERFWRKVDKSGDCWIWNGALTKGYGQMSYAKRHVYAHRFSWEIHKGPIPDGMHVCHRCDTPRCVNPDHLFIGTAHDNIIDKLAKGRQGPTGARGPSNGMVRIKQLPATHIRDLYLAGMGVREIAPKFGVSKSTIHNIVTGKHWSVQNEL